MRTEPCTDDRRAATHALLPSPRQRRTGPSRRWSLAALMRVASALLVASLSLSAGPARALLTIQITDIRELEGNSGQRVVGLPVTLPSALDPQTQLRLTVQSLIGYGNGAVGGDSCAPGIDFIRLTDVPFRVSPYWPYVPVTICGDTVPELGKYVEVVLTHGLAEGRGVLLIEDDDGPLPPPTLAINNIAVSEPVLRSGKATFTVTMSNVFSSTVLVNFATRNGTAGALDYAPKFGTLGIPRGELTGTITVGIFPDFINEKPETFFVDLSAPVNATLVDGTGQATIYDGSSPIGDFEISPSEASAAAGDTVVYQMDWIVPDNLVWRNLKSLDFRLHSPGRVALWLRWDEASNAFSLCHRLKANGHREDDGDDADDAATVLQAAEPTPPVAEGATACGPGLQPGSASVLATRHAALDLRGAVVKGSGSTGQRVSLTLPIRLSSKASRRSFDVELAAADDFGRVDAFVRVGTLRLAPRGHR